MDAEAGFLKELAPLLGAKWRVAPLHLPVNHVRDTTGRLHLTELANLLDEQGFAMNPATLHKRGFAILPAA